MADWTLPGKWEIYYVPSHRTDFDCLFGFNVHFCAIMARLTGCGCQGTQTQGLKTANEIRSARINYTCSYPERLYI
jgi:hypothetical protein